MTVIVGLVDDGRVLMGADSAATTAGLDLTVRRDPKVFTSGPYVIGFTTSFRMGQLLRWKFEPPAPPENPVELDRFMRTEFVDAAREALRDGRWSRVDNAREEGGHWLVGVAGRLFFISADFQVGESVDDYYAIGSGGDLARGALHATTGQVADKRVLAALAAAQAHNAAVREPFHLIWQPR